MPDVEGAPTVPLRESFTFDAHYAQCIIEDNPEPFSMETYTMGKVVIERHSFFMGMYANEISRSASATWVNGTRVAKLTGALGCATEAGHGYGARGLTGGAGTSLLRDRGHRWWAWGWGGTG